MQYFQTSATIDVYLEIGKKRTFAGAMDWPGWCRSARDEPSALQALVDYGPRYARVLHGTRLDFREPANASLFAVIERLEGDATTDFGAPGKSPSTDASPVDRTELQRFQTLLQACWQAFDAAVRAAGGRELRRGPRGGGRDLAEIVRHLLDTDAAYLALLGWKLEKERENDPTQVMTSRRQAILSALAVAAGDGMPKRGPRGGVRWTPRYFVRRVAWHALDHAWEIEDRILPG
jgi:hypothetical protein